LRIFRVSDFFGVNKIGSRRPKLPVSVNFDPLAERMRKLRATQELLAKLSGLPAMAISKAANHQSDLAYIDWRRVEAVIADLEEICRRAGVLVDWRNHEVLKAKLAELEDERRNPPGLPTPEDYQLMRAIGTNTGVGFVDVAQQLGCTVSDLLQMLEGANRRFAYMGHQMSSWTNARKAHITNSIETLQES
jgi:hypothetical protein